LSKIEKGSHIVTLSIVLLFLGYSKIESNTFLNLLTQIIMLKYLFFTLLFCISTPCFCGTNQAANPTFTSIFTENNLVKKHQKVFSKQAVLKKIRLEKQLPIFGVVSIIAGLLGFSLAIFDNAPCRGWLTLIGAILIILGIGLGITGIIIGEVALWSILGILFSPIILLATALILEIRDKERN
jgi:hypothetical protein